jgi:hypothetical protein
MNQPEAKFSIIPRSVAERRALAQAVASADKTTGTALRSALQIGT